MEFLRKALLEWNISLTEDQTEKFETYYRLLLEWNQKMNLTSVTDYEEVQKKHFLDSLSIIKILNPESVSSVIDLGTGAGFPGIPLKILFPSLQLTLADSLNKRITFLNMLRKELNLADVTTIHARAEELARRQEYRENYDLCVSRAVANLSTLSEYCLPFVKIKGNFVAYKSADVEEELSAAENAIRLLGGLVKEKKTFVLPGTDYGRSLIRIEKIKPAPKRYPRKAGTPSREPL